jgi:hypothetical protein
LNGRAESLIRHCGLIVRLVCAYRTAVRNVNLFIFAGDAPVSGRDEQTQGTAAPRRRSRTAGLTGLLAENLDLRIINVNNSAAFFASPCCVTALRCCTASLRQRLD